MHSARKLVTSALLLAAISGCQRAADPREVALSNAPIVEDEAMQLRQWEPSVSHYASGVSPSYPTLYPYVARRDLAGAAGFVLNPAIFFAQTALLPITFFAAPAWEMEDAQGTHTPATYTAVPAVRPDAESWENDYSGWGVFAPSVDR